MVKPRARSKRRRIRPATRLRLEQLERRDLLTAAGPAIVATMSDFLAIDADGDGKADPGDTIGYEVTILNQGGVDARDVVFLARDNGMAFWDSSLGLSGDEVFPSGLFTRLVEGSVNVSPLAFDDAYTAIGNTLLDSRELGLPGLFQNDVEFLGDTFSLRSFATTSSQGGDVLVRGDGSFTYLPPVGFRGVDTFTYTIADSAGLSGSARVRLTITDLVWYVDQNSSGGDGRSTSPFRDLAPLNAPDGAGDRDGPGDYIYLQAGEAAYEGGIVLEDDQRLIGSGEELAVRPYSLRSAGESPRITHAAGDGVVVADRNYVGGIAILETAGSGLSGQGVSSGTFGSLQIINPGGSGIDLRDIGDWFEFDGPIEVELTRPTSDYGILIESSRSDSGAIFEWLRLSATDARESALRVAGLGSFNAKGRITAAGGDRAIELENSRIGVSLSGLEVLDSKREGVLIHDVSGTLEVGTTTIRNSGAAGISIQNMEGTAEFFKADIATRGAAGIHARQVAGGLVLRFGDATVQSFGDVLTAGGIQPAVVIQTEGTAGVRLDLRGLVRGSSGFAGGPDIVLQQQGQSILAIRPA